MFPLNNVGIVTARDSVLISENTKELLEKVSEYFKVSADVSFTKPISYRPFDNRFVYYDTKMVERARKEVMQHFILGENVGLSFIRINKEDNYSGVFITKNIAEARLGDRFITNIAPLYLYSDSQINSSTRQPNLDSKIVDEIAKKLKLQFIPDHLPSQELRQASEHIDSVPDGRQAGKEGTFNPLDVLDYIYAILHSPSYRQRYKEFLKIDFPRIPFTSDQKLFWKLVEKGRELREYHLMEHKDSSNLITKFPIAGENEVSQIKFCLTPLAGENNSPSSKGWIPPKLEDGVANDSKHQKILLTTINNKNIYRNFVENLPYNPKLKDLAKQKRQEGILSEVLFWQQVNKRKFYNLDFDRQRVIGTYIVDFYIKALGLVIEIDGASHDNKNDYDKEREHYLKQLGLVIYRVADAEIKQNLSSVLEDLKDFIIENFGEETTPSQLWSGHPSKGGEFLVGQVWINETQYFDSVPQIAWEFYIGGYQPAQKWLKDRKGHKLNFDEILHYQRIIVALVNTDRVMKKIDGLIIDWPIK
jgi:very-short-patch-repair endonuclease